MRHPFVLALIVSIFLLEACGEQSSPASSTTPSRNASAYQIAQRDYLDDTVAAATGGTYGGLAHIARGVTPPAGSFDHGLQEMDTRSDTADFNLPGLLTLLYRYWDAAALDEPQRQRIEQSVIAFKYWPDELQEVPGTTDAQSLVTWTENHFILFSSGAYLAGQLYPDTVFPASGRTGQQQMAVFRPRIMQWLELRYRSGFSEWLSNVYYNEDMPALLALIELAEDQEIVAKARIVLDLMFADLALNNFRGNFGATHGRTYTHKMNGNRDSTRSAMHLAFGLHSPRPGNMTATMMALSKNYRVPEVLRRIANATDSTAMENRQRMGIKLEEASRWGLDLNDIDDGMTLLTMEPYAHPLFVDLFYDMLNAYQWWDLRDFAPFNDVRTIISDRERRAAIAREFEWDLTRNMRPEVNIYTYRTPHYMLSTAQDWRKGFGGDQSSIWQATLGMEAVAFTTHPGNEEREGPTPNYWTGYGTLPRAAQIKNVGITLYDIETRGGVYYPKQPLYTHAFLPRAKFDETAKEKQWFFARKGDAYLALWSSDPSADWVKNNDSGAHGGADYEIIAKGEKTLWICELGDAQANGDFQSFKDAIHAAKIDADTAALTISYLSPSQGKIDMGWDGPVLHEGQPVQLQDYSRYDNPWSQSAFPGDNISFTYDDTYLKLNFNRASREANAFVE